MWKIFFEYSDKSKMTLTGKTKEISDRLIEKYYREYGRTAASAKYQQYPKKDHPARDFIAMYHAMNMEPCPLCGHKAVVVHNFDWKDRGLSFHVCCNRTPGSMDDVCELIAGYDDEETGEIKWFDSEMEAINYWNERSHRKE